MGPIASRRGSVWPSVKYVDALKTEENFVRTSSDDIFWILLCKMPHKKINHMAVCYGKTQISQGISSFRFVGVHMKKTWAPSNNVLTERRVKTMI